MPDLPGRPVSLLWRVWSAHAAVLLVATGALALTPLTVSSPLVGVEAALLLAGLLALLGIDLALLRRLLGPLRRLTQAMTEVDPLRPGTRLELYGPSREVRSLTSAFNDMLARLEAERRDSARRELLAQEGERRRIARELHDQVGQALTLVVLTLDGLARELPAPGDERAGEAREQVRHALEDVRRLSRELRPGALDDLGLASAVRELSAQFTRATGVSVARRVSAELPALAPEAELALYRITQEALTNAARHAGARRVELELAPDGAAVRLRVRDDGRGLAAGVGAGGSGLLGMRERALLAGAELSIDAPAAGGTEICVRVGAVGS